MKIPTILDVREYQLKNYRILDNKEQKIALEFRNKNRKWMINKEVIEIEHHKNWIKTLERDTSSIFYLVFKDNIPFMSISFHDIDFTKKEAYWGYFLGKEKYTSEVLKIQKIIIDIGFSELNLDKLMTINAIENVSIKIHKFFGFKEDEVVKINGEEFLKMYLLKSKL